MRLLIVDNYDSFTYNLRQLFSEAGCRDVTIIRNDQIVLSDVADFDKIILSPGAGIPEEIPVMKEILSRYQYNKSILGICLGHQAIACFYGAKLRNLEQVFHGISCQLRITDTGAKLFQDFHGAIQVGRYHSWAIEEDSLPSCLRITSKADDGCIMSIEHKEFDITGMQFHPESFITVSGNKLIRNWLNS